ncbi:hypothetical protein E4U61_002685 [Claviceps capensis]|nr:hypothetical protein E4U61_002685 [Claviceps capensis]
MILPSLSVGFVSTLTLGSLLSCVEASRGTLKDGVVDLGSVAQLSRVAREAPPDYKAPTYDYDDPPPYQYATSTLAGDPITLTSTDSLPNTVIDTTTVATNGQSSYHSDTTTSVIVSQNTDNPASPSSSTWVESSVLGITGTSTTAISETTTFSSVGTLSTTSESTTSTELTPSLPMSSGIVSNSSSIIGTSTSSPHANNTWTTTMTGNPETSTTESVPSSRLTFESSQLPITASASSWSNYSSSSTTWSSATTEPGTATNPVVSSLKPSSTPPSLTWPPVFNTTISESASASVSPSVSTPINANSTLSPSGIQTNTTSSKQTAIWPTSYGQTSTSGNSSQSLSSTTSSYGLSQTVSDGNPRTKTYFSSQWANSTSVSTQDGTFSGPTQILTSHTSVPSIPTSLPLSTWYTTPNTSTLAITTQETRTVSLSSGIGRNTTFQSSPSPPFSIPANSTASPPTSSGFSWIQSSVLGTGITLTSGIPTVSAPTQGPPWSSKIVSIPPFQNSTTTFSFSGTGPSIRTSTGNTTYHNPWTPSTVSLPTITSIVWSSRQPQSSQLNSTDSSVWVTVDPQTSTQSSPYQSSSVAISTGFTSGVPISHPGSNSTYHWPTTMKSSTSHSSISTDYESSSETFKSTFTRTMLNSTSVQTLSRPSTSTMQQWTNSTLTMQPTLSSNTSSTSNVDTSSTLPTSETVTNSSYVPSSTSWSETSAQQTTASLVTSRWYNSTVDGVPHSTTNSNGSTSTRVTATTYPSVSATSSGTTSLNVTSGRTVMPSSTTETSSERTLSSSITLSTDKTHDQTPSSQPVSTQTRSEATSTYSLSSSITPTTTGNSAPVSTSTTSSRCARRKKTKSSSLETQSRTAIETEPVLTTLKTLASTEKGTSERQASDSPSSTTVIEPQPTPDLPKNPNFPWGGDSPIHRHQSIGQLGAGVPKERLWKRWTRKVKDTMEFVRL